MLSAVIPHLETDIGKRDVLSECISSFTGHYDELLVVAEKNDSLPNKINTAVAQTRGEWVVVSNDDVKLLKGSLRDLCTDAHVTTPTINGAVNQGYSGHIFCIRRYIWDEVGGYDEGYEKFYFDDTDFEYKLRALSARMECVRDVDVYHPPEGGRTLHQIEGHEEAFERNKKRFADKWGQRALDEVLARGGRQ